MNRLLTLACLLTFALAAHAQPSSCSSDGQKPPAALLERFINADCDACWRDKQAPEPASGTLAIDWVVPGSRGDDAPLAAVATRDASGRLDAIRATPPAQSSSVFHRRPPDALKLRVAHGVPVADFIGTSIELRGAGAEPLTAWLLLVETLPAGTEGSRVERNLVRGAFTTEWRGKDAQRYELRTMRVDEGVKASRLRVVGWLEDARGNIRAIAQSRCKG